jgi:hypothetical protein
MHQQLVVDDNRAPAEDSSAGPSGSRRDRWGARQRDLVENGESAVPGSSLKDRRADHDLAAVPPSAWDGKALK